MKEEFGKLSRILTMLYSLLSGNFPVSSYVIINSQISQKQSYVGQIFLITPKKVLKETWDCFNTKFQP